MGVQHWLFEFWLIRRELNVHRALYHGGQLQKLRHEVWARAKAVGIPSIWIRSRAHAAELRITAEPELAPLAAPNMLMALSGAISGVAAMGGRALAVPHFEWCKARILCNRLGEHVGAAMRNLVPAQMAVITRPPARGSYPVAPPLSHGHGW